jgi:hypothetical protein
MHEQRDFGEAAMRISTHTVDLDDSQGGISREAPEALGPTSSSMARPGSKRSHRTEGHGRQERPSGGAMLVNSCKGDFMLGFCSVVELRVARYRGSATLGKFRSRWEAN